MGAACDMWDASAGGVECEGSEVGEADWGDYGGGFGE